MSDERLRFALQPIGCAHTRTFVLTQLGDPAARSGCQDCPSEWMDRTHRMQRWDP